MSDFSNYSDLEIKQILHQIINGKITMTEASKLYVIPTEVINKWMNAFVKSVLADL